MVNLLKQGIEDKKLLDPNFQIPENDEEILRFLDTAVLEEQSTDVLVQLAEKLKNRRAQQST